MYWKWWGKWGRRIHKRGIELGVYCRMLKKEYNLFHNTYMWSILFQNLIIFLEQHLKLLLAFIVGCVGSFAYITALYFKFIGDTEDNRRIVMSPFLNLKSEGGRIVKKMSFSKVAWYCGIGGGIAVIFQFDVPNFVAVQCLILGATWPAIVSQFLSGRMANPSQKELDALDKMQETSSVPSYRTNTAYSERLKRIIEKEKNDSQ